MSKDQRLYSKFAIDFHRHPKIDRLTDKAFRTFVEMVGEARIADNDGVFQAEDAEFMWDAEVLAQLVRSHPTRPLVIHEGGTYRIRDYDKHQQTRAEREELARVARENGAKGGRPRKPRRNPDITQGVSEITQTEPSGTQTKAESESESELEIDDFRTSSQSGLSPVTRARDGDMTDYYETVRQVLMHDAGIPDPSTDEIHAWVTYVASKARTAVKDERAYALGAIDRSPDEVDKWFVKHRRNNLKAVGE